MIVCSPATVYTTGDLMIIPILQQVARLVLHRHATRYYMHSDHDKTLPISLQFTGALRVALGDPEDVDAERNTDNARYDQWPGVTPYLG